MKNLSTEHIDFLRHDARCVVRELGLLNDAYYDIGVTLAERHLLIELSNCTSPTAGEIAERLLLDKSTTSRLVARALKKGYIKCSTDKKDKRKRHVELTEKGEKTLKAFEPIAFKQTKDALLTLTPDEIEMVYQGIGLYAKGLKNSRLGNKPQILEKENLHEDLSLIHKHLAKLGYVLKPYSQEDETALYSIFQEVVNSGDQFPYESSSIQEFQKQFLDPKFHIYVCLSPVKEVIGGFYIRENFSGRSNHIANAAYMITSAHRGLGIGRLLVKASLLLAKGLGFQAMQFNMVLSQNAIAVQLYQKLGFNIIGTIPQSIRNPDGSYQDSYIMHRKLDNL